MHVTGKWGGLKAAWWEGGVSVLCVCPGPPGRVLGGQSLGLLCPKVRGEEK